jgi:hypothetical protein
MNERIQQQRERLIAFFNRYRPMSRNAICKKAGASESTVGAFIRGGKRAPRFLTDETYNKLSTWSGWTINELKGDAPIPSPEGLMSRKSENKPDTGNDSETILSHSNGGGSDTPEREGDMVNQLRLELVDRLWGIPADRLEGLKKHMDAIEAAMAQLPRPHQRGKTAS